ncbi:Na+/H+ antiporter subunit E [Novispirillum sp. DQ9]|uniref:Na+/H+ antiporter subunit E n=1 Tax=Novispirillum sp. DQ9 TaxID=3398612 RepID=UPI003C7AF6B2
MINLLAVNILLAIAWAALNGTFSLAGLVVGFVVAFVALWVALPLYRPSSYFTQVIGILHLIFYFLWDLIQSSVRVLVDVLRPVSKSRPGIVAVSTEGMTDIQILTLANLITLTPGTLSLEVSDDRKTLYVHAMFLDGDPEGLRQGIEDNQKRLIRRVVGGEQS